MRSFAVMMVRALLTVYHIEIFPLALELCSKTTVQDPDVSVFAGADEGIFHLHYFYGLQLKWLKLYSKERLNPLHRSKDGPVRMICAHTALASLPDCTVLWQDIASTDSTNTASTVTNALLWGWLN